MENYKKFRDNENNRNLDERHVAKLVASFRKNGWDIEPITVNKDYVIISGHHRLAAAVQAEVDIKYTIADVDYTSTQLQHLRQRLVVLLIKITYNSTRST